MSTSTRNRGFIALLSIIILGFVLLLTVFTLGSRSIGGRFLLLDLERKEMSVELASACVHVAIIALVSDPLYTPPTPSYAVPVGESECEIVSIAHDNPPLSTIRAHGEVGSVSTNVEAVWDSDLEEVDSWRELPVFE